MSASGEKKARSRVVVKEEPQDEDAWKGLPAVDEAALSAARSRAASPLELKSNEAHSMNAIARPEMDGHVTTNDTTSAPRVTSTSAPTQPSRPRMRQSFQTQPALPSTTETDLDDAARKLKELDLYDFKDSSSPASATSSAAPDPTAKPSLPPPRTNRRHSSIPKDATKSTSDQERIRPASRTATATSAASRRRSMMT
jgi:hypothetical protein